ncbi:MAG: twin-arginine translocase subunit TatC [Methanobacteriota archaeon]
MAAAEMGKEPGERRMSFFEHLDELRQRLRVVVAFLLVFFVLFIAFDVQFFDVGGVPVPVPVPSVLSNNTADRVVRYLVDYYKPPDVELKNFQIWDAVIVEVKVAFFLAVILSSPVMAYEFGKFIGPALKPSERRIILRVAIPVLALFLSGVVLAHLVVLPFTFDFLYSVARRLGVETPLLFVDEFISFVTVFLVAFGAAFELPVVMYAVTAVGLVDASFWKRHWRFAVIAIFVFGAIVTPDGSGVTMILVSIPMLALYVGGYVAVWSRERRAKSS